MNDKRLQVDPVALHGQLVRESPQLKRGLELLSNLDFTTIVPAAVLIHNNQMLVIEDASLIVDWDYRFTDWNGQIPRALALHYFTLEQDRSGYCSTTFVKLMRIDAQLLTQTFAIIEDHLIVKETYDLHPDNASFSTDSVWAEQVFTLNGEFIAVLTDDPTLLERFRQKHVSAKAVKISDPRYYPWFGVASSRIFGLGDTLDEPNVSHGDPDPSRWEELRFAVASEVFTELYEDPTADEVIITAFPLPELEHFLRNVYPDYTFWDILSSGKVSVSKGSLYLSADFQDVLLANNAQEYRFAGTTRAGCEVLINWAKPKSLWNPVHLTYCWIEEHQIKAIHFPVPTDEIESLNRFGSLKYTFREELFTCVIHNATLYFICDDKYSETSAIMAFDVRTSTVAPILPKVPRNMSVMHRES